MTAETMPLRYGLTAVYVTRAQLAAQQRAQARKKPQQPHDDPQQLESEEPSSGTQK